MATSPAVLSLPKPRSFHSPDSNILKSGVNSKTGTPRGPVPVAGSSAFYLLPLLSAVTEQLLTRTQRAQPGPVSLPLGVLFSFEIAKSFLSSGQGKSGDPPDFACPLKRREGCRMKPSEVSCFLIALVALPGLCFCGGAESALVSRLCPAFATLVTFLPRLLHGSAPAGACGDRRGTRYLLRRSVALPAARRDSMEDPTAVSTMDEASSWKPSKAAKIASEDFSLPPLAFPGNVEVSGVVARRKTLGKGLTFVTFEIVGCEVKPLSKAVVARPPSSA